MCGRRSEGGAEGGACEVEEEEEQEGVTEGDSDETPTRAAN